MPIEKRDDLPSTLQRSPAKAQRTFAKTLHSAEEQYSSEERARRTAFAALKHSHEKVGDHWEAKDETGPSDAQAAKSGGSARRGGRTHGGVDVKGHTKAELMERAKDVGVEGRSKMNKDELAAALDAANRRESARSLRKERT